MEWSSEDEEFDWASALPPQHAHPANLEGAGAVCETKRFDSFYNDSGHRVVLPAGQKYNMSKSRAYESALTVVTHWDRRLALEKTELEIKSPHMKAALKAVIPQYEPLNIEIRHITITGEPQCLFIYRQELLSYGVALQGQDDHDPEALGHILHLLKYMWEVFATEISAFSKYELTLNDDPSLEHKYLWMVFRSGDIVYVQEPHRKALVFESISLSGDSWKLSGVFIDRIGDKFGFREVDYYIGRYDGVKSLRKLDVVHFNHLTVSERESLKEELVARGRKFINIRQHQCLWYNGKPNKPSDSKTRTRIMADDEGYRSERYARRFEFMSGKTTFDASDAQDEMTETDLMVCHNFIAGYSLRDNEWDTFHIDSISDVNFDPLAFNALILPEDQKQQIRSLVRIHENETFAFDDLIQGKGRGMIFLLYGEPGVGKTLTAESIADICHKPLIRLDAGTLGTSAGSVERGLKHAFALAEKWHAVLLLDEADVYLEQRKSKNLVHNGIVSVFLRVIEYYHGILFLTTNRIATFDAAFISRIHLAIHYPPLAAESRCKLFYTFLKQTSLESAEALSQQGVLKALAQETLNGRQIRNLVRTACALALSDDVSSGLVERKHLEMALRPLKQFARTFEEELAQPGAGRDQAAEGRSNSDEEVDDILEDTNDTENDATPGDEDVEDVEDVEDGEDGEDGEDDYDSEDEDGEDYDEESVIQESKRRRLY